MFHVITNSFSAIPIRTQPRIIRRSRLIDSLPPRPHKVSKSSVIVQLYSNNPLAIDTSDTHNGQAAQALLGL